MPGMGDLEVGDGERCYTNSCIHNNIRQTQLLWKRPRRGRRREALSLDHEQFAKRVSFLTCSQLYCEWPKCPYDAVSW